MQKIQNQILSQPQSPKCQINTQSSFNINKNNNQQKKSNQQIKKSKQKSNDQSIKQNQNNIKKISNQLQQSISLQKQQVLPQILSKIQSGDYFDKLFQIQQNSNCFQCSKKSKQWAQTTHGVFLCLTCAANWKQISSIVNVKSIRLDLWNTEQMKIFQLGGNTNFKQFLKNYDLDKQDAKTILRSTSAEYYRRFMKSKLNGQIIQQKPSWQDGRKVYVVSVPLIQMSPQQIVQTAKQNIKWAGQQGIKYGTKAYQTIKTKYQTGQLKQDTLKVVNEGKRIAQQAYGGAKQGAKFLWGLIATKVTQITKPKPNNQQN